MIFKISRPKHLYKMSRKRKLRIDLKKNDRKTECVDAHCILEYVIPYSSIDEEIR